MNTSIDRIIRSKRKSYGIEISPQGQVTIRAPLRASDHQIHKVIEEKSKWISNKKQLILSRPKVGPKRFMEGEKFLFMGNHYALVLSDHTKKPLELDQYFFLARKHHPKAREVFIKWYKKQAKTRIIERVEGHAAFAGLKYKDIKVSSALRRWGSCSSQRNLNFSWRLILAPVKVIDYVVVHELAHLEEMNHSRHFWNQVELMLPDYKIHKKWLKDHGHSLVFE